MAILRLFKITSLYLVYSFFIFPLATDEGCSVSPLKPFLLGLANYTPPTNGNYLNEVDSWGIHVALASPKQERCLVAIHRYK